MASAASSTHPTTFEGVWEEFINKVRPYNSTQKKHILLETRTALQHVLNCMPAPRREGLDDPTPSPTGSLKRMLPDLETFLYDRIHGAGEGKSLWLRWDNKSTGSVTLPQFKASIASLGSTLTEEEVNALAAKFPSSTLDKGICYTDLWKYLLAQSEKPRSTSQSSFSAALLNRPSTSGRGFANLLADLQPHSVEDRLTRGLKTMRETMYTRSANFHALFLALQDKNTKMVAINDLLPQLPKLGFPANLCSEVELHDVASRSCQKKAGWLSYGEFLAFCTGHDAVILAPSSAGSGGAGAHDASLNVSVPGPLDSPSLLNALTKINNINLRKFFKECDADNDGLLTTAELAQGLVDHAGLHKTQTQDKAFLNYLESFAQRKPGHFGYAEFIKFVNTRSLGNTGNINGQPLMHNASASVRIPDDQTPSQMLETIVKALRSSNVSVESVFNQFDCDFDGQLDEAEFYLGISSLGFTLSPLQSKAFFDAVDTNHNGAIDIHEFASLIVNPLRNSKLSTRVAQPPGGASSVPMGSFAPEETARPSTGRAAVAGQRPGWELSASQTPLSAQEQTPQRSQVKHVPAVTSIDLSFPQPGDNSSGANASAASFSAAAASAASSGGDLSLVSPRSRAVPKCGQSSIDFVNDHGHVTPSKVGGAANKNSDAGLLHFDPLHPLSEAKNKRGGVGAGRPTEIVLSDDVDEDAAAREREALTPRRGRPVGSPKLSASRVSFNQADSEPVVTGRRILDSPGGFSDLSLACPERPGSPFKVPAVRRAQDEVQVDLAFHPEGAPGSEDDVPARRVRGAGATPNVSTMNLAHSSSRVEADLSETSHMDNHKTRRYLAGSPAAVRFGDETSAALLDSYRSPEAPLDADMVKRLSAAVHAHSQRLRHTFQEWNKGTSAALSRANFVAGAAALGVQLTEQDTEQIFQRFDADGDDHVSYGEFVKLLSLADK